MNRETILQCIGRHLDAHARDSTTSIPLGELVQAIARELRSHGSIASDPSTVTAIPLVAAFVDGNVSAEEERIVCTAIMRDNSVLAEVVASIQAPHDRNTLPALAPELVNRLIGLVPPPLAEQPLVIPVQNAEPKSAPRFARRAAPAARRTQTIRWLAGMSAAAALLLIATQSGLLSRWLTPSQPQESLAQPTKTPAPDAPWDNATPSNPPDSIAQQETPAQPIPEQPTIQPPTATPFDPGRNIADVGTTPTIPAPEAPKSSNSPSVDPTVPGPPPSNQPKPRNLRWTKIQGVLARSTSQLGDRSEDGYLRWSGIAPDTIVSQKDLEQLDLLWNTLPQSRAEGELEEGGSIVVAPDTLIAINQSKTNRQLRLDRGSVALVDMPLGSSVELLVEDQPLASMRWKSSGTLVVSIASNGVFAQIDGSLECNGSVYEDALLQLGDQIIQRGGKSKFPPWVHRKVEPIDFPKAVLSQLRASDDVARTLLPLLQQGTIGMDPATWTQLQAWTMLSSGRDLHLIFGQGTFAQRAAAIDRLLQQPSWIPSNRRLWQAFEASSQNGEQIRILATLVDQLRGNQPFAPVQLEQLLFSLESLDPATRSLADALLRRNFGNGPRYDPLAPQANSGRMINLWRRFLAAQ